MALVIWIPREARTRGTLMTRLDGLPSDEPFAIPAIRAVPVSSESSWLAIYEVSTVRTGLDHNQQL